MLSSSGLVLLDPANGQNAARLRMEDRAVPSGAAARRGKRYHSFATGMSMGTRALRLKKSNGQYAAEELWTSRQLKPDFVDLVTYHGHAYGNDGGILTCIDLQTGERKWKGGRYGKGQILLLEKFRTVAHFVRTGTSRPCRRRSRRTPRARSFQALEGKTWNHPVLVGDRLYVRNSQAGRSLSRSAKLASEKTTVKKCRAGIRPTGTSQSQNSTSE